MIRLSARFAPALVAITVVAAALQLGAVRGARGEDPCASPESLRATTLIPGSAALGERLELLDDATFQWSEGEVPNPMHPSQPMRFQIVRSYASAWLSENPLKFAFSGTGRPAADPQAERRRRLQPEELRVVMTASEAGVVPIRVAWDHTESRVLLGRSEGRGPSRLAAWFFVFDNRAVSSPVREQLRGAVGLAVGGARPLSLVMISALATEETVAPVEAAATAWLARAWEYTARSCRPR